MADDTLSIKIQNLVLEVHGYQFPDLDDYWDGNWLVCTATVETSGARVVSRGSFLRNDELQCFRDEICKLHSSLSGKAELVPLEPNLKVVLAPFGTGQISIKVEISPDHLSEFHRFEFGLDQTYLPEIVKLIDAVLASFPIRGSAN
jgi:hypothetical protein